MDIEYLTNVSLKQWNDYVLSGHNATFYHLAEWKEVMESAFDHKTYYLMVKDKGLVTGILPLVQIKSLLFGNILCSMPFLNFGGIVADTREAQKYLLEEAQQILSENHADYVEFRHLHRSPGDLPCNERKVSMTISLDADPDVLWNKFKSKHRTNIRRAFKNDLEIVQGGQDHLDAFYKLLSTGWRDLGTPIYRIDFFQRILDVFGDAIQIYLVFHRGNPIATAFNGVFNGTVEGMWAYASRDYVRLQPNYALYWQMIKDACESGCHLFHLGRSTNESGATFFKSKWNAELHQLYWEYLLNGEKITEMPELNVDNPKYRLAIRMWQKLPVTVTNLIGPMIAKSIP